MRRLPIAGAPSARPSGSRWPTPVVIAGRRTVALVDATGEARATEALRWLRARGVRYEAWRGPPVGGSRNEAHGSLKVLREPLPSNLGPGWQVHAPLTELAESLRSWSPTTRQPLLIVGASMALAVDADALIALDGGTPAPAWSAEYTELNERCRPWVTLHHAGSAEGPELVDGVLRALLEADGTP